MRQIFPALEVSLFLEEHTQITLSQSLLRNGELLKPLPFTTYHNLMAQHYHKWWVQIVIGMD